MQRVLLLKNTETGKDNTLNNTESASFGKLTTVTRHFHIISHLREQEELRARNKNNAWFKVKKE